MRNFFGGGLTRLKPWFPGQLGIAGSDNNLGLLTQSEGAVFYVDNSHADSNDSHDGTDPEHPLKTITHALVHCTTNVNDTIIVTSLSAALETFPITISKAKVHIYGADFSDDFAKIGRVLVPTGDTAAFYVTGDKVEIAGFELGAGATHACIESNTAAQSWGLHVHHCDFGWMNTGRDGICLGGAVDAVQPLIHDNRFNDKLTRDGIRIEQNATRGEIWNNIFRNVGGIGIDLVGGCTDIYAIHDNAFRTLDTATGQAITFANANSVGCMIYGNQTMQLNVAMGLVPYRDLGNNHWGLNYYDIRAIMPVTI